MLCVLVITLALVGCEVKEEAAVYTGVLEGTSVHVPALTGGKIIRLDVREGDEVGVGDTVAVTDTRELVLQERQVAAALEELDVQQEIAQDGLDRAGVDLAYVQEKHGRMKELFEKESVPRQRLDDVANQLDRVKTAVASARKQVRILEAKRGQLDAQVDLIRKRVADAVSVSPIEGRVVTRYFEPGEAVPPMQAVAELMHVKTLDVKVYVAEEKLPHIKTGQAVTVHADGLDRSFPGRVIWISNRAEFTPKTILTPETRASLVYAVKVQVENPDEVLKDGMPVEVRWENGI
ncbi:MAG: efflux RND transporter periplasmic adaptor subunit [bacterium]|nr:efflux RND transporter periplasmic adaptor subunit [bacterium]